MEPRLRDCRIDLQQIVKALKLLRGKAGYQRRFRTPSLRELRYTAPYMHNGVFATLRDVVDFFDRGGGESPNKAPQLRPLGLSLAEKQDLVAFLESLSMDQPLLLAPPRVPESMPLTDGGKNAHPR